MRIDILGARGSCPGLTKHKVKYGGNTTCIRVSLDNGKSVIIDAGSGIRTVGQSLLESQAPIHLLQTHVHWDHIQGFPFFAPIYQDGQQINIYSPDGDAMLKYLTDQMDGVCFPLTTDAIKATLTTSDKLNELSHELGCTISYIQANHPGQCYGYRIEADGHSLVFLPDNQLGASDVLEQDHALSYFVDFCDGADILIHDAQYIDSDMPFKRDWGHSLASEALNLALASNVSQLVLFHHDPDRQDQEIDAIQDECLSTIQSRKSNLKCCAAYDGMVITL
ncbi:MBL fold metallo-hydrolase [bacterium]|jgi:phosphoribosyl 1,2-cyclic phosphodiesterase|nr:MBL fold metallo-hydrolase [bacterium]